MKSTMGILGLIVFIIAFIDAFYFKRFDKGCFELVFSIWLKKSSDDL